MDDRVQADYGTLLLPRAVGYSASLLDYFFRGKLDVELFSDSNDPSIVRLEGSNGSTDKLDGGTLELYADDPDGKRSRATALGSTAVAANPGDPITSTTFQAPANAERFIAVYKGKLGDEVPQGDFPGGVIGKILGGVRVEQVYRDSTRWHIRTPTGVYPTEILVQDVQDLQWGDNDNTLVGRSRIGPGQANLFYAYRINRPLGLTDLPVRTPSASLPDQPTAKQVVDIQVTQQVPFPYGINTGTSVQFSHTINYSQYILLALQRQTREYSNGLYREPGYEWVNGSVNPMVIDARTFNNAFPVILDASSMLFGDGRPYRWIPQSISLTKDNKLLVLVFVWLNRPQQPATFPAFELVPQDWNDGNSPLVPTQVDSVSLFFGVPAMGPALWALIDISSGQVVANTAPASLTINYETAVVQLGSRPSAQTVRYMGRSTYVGGPFDGELRWENAGVIETGAVTARCTEEQRNNMSVWGEVNAQSGYINAAVSQYKPEIGALEFPPIGGPALGTRKLLFTCGEAGLGVPPLGFTTTASVPQPGRTRIDQALRNGSASGADSLALLLAQGQTDGDFARVVNWFPSENRAELRGDITSEGFHFIYDSSSKAALVITFLGDTDTRLVSLEGTLSTKVFPDRVMFEMTVLEPNFFYNMDDLKFHTTDPSIRATSLPATLASTSESGNPQGRYHTIEVK